MLLPIAGKKPAKKTAKKTGAKKPAAKPQRKASPAAADRDPAGGLKRCRGNVAMVVPRPETSIEDEIAHLRGLDLGGLRARWQNVFRRPAPAHLTRHLLFAVIAYRLQADRFGDLGHATLQVLDRTAAKEAGPAMSARLATFDQKRNRAYSRHGPSSRVGSTVAAGDGDA